MDPFRGRRRLYTSHFRDRLGQRHAPRGFVEDALRRGVRERRGDEYRATCRGHHIVLVKHACRLTLITISKD